jgi:hypothetical protein
MKFGSVILAALGLSLTANTALALPSVTNAFTNGFQQFSDNSGEIVFDPSGNVVSTLAVGDIFAGVVQISSFPSTNVNASSLNQLTAIFAVVIDSITPVPAALIPSVCGSAAVTTCSGFSFSSDGQSLAHWLGIAAANPANPLFGYAVPAGLTGANTILAAYEGNGNTGAFIDSGTILQDEQNASSGTLRLLVSDGHLGDSWTGAGPTTLAQLALVPPGQGAGSFTIAETISSQFFPGYIFAPLVTGQGTISFNPLDPFGVTDNTSFFVNIHGVPEPVSLSLFGAGLIGAASMGRRKKKA